MASLNSAHLRTSKYEGGFADVKGDNGGFTYKGISRRFFPGWAGWKIVDRNLPLKWNDVIKDPELDHLVEEFYRYNFWNPIKGDLYKHQIIAEFVYDYAVNSGIGRASKKLQAAVGAVQDGKIGPATVALVNSKDPVQLLTTLKNERIAFLKTIAAKPGQAKFLNGWLARVNGFKI